MRQKRDEQPIYLLRFGQPEDRWRISLKTPQETLYFVTLEAFMLFLAQKNQVELGERVEGRGEKRVP